MSAKEIVDSAIKENQIVIFAKTFCAYCRATRHLFDENYADCTKKIFELDEMKNGNDIQEYLTELTGQRTVPNVFVGGKFVGGNDKIQALQREGQLAPMLKAAA